MQIYPAIDIKDGKCVRLQQGRFDQVTVYGDNPVDMALQWVEAGASYLHLVDLDGAVQGQSANHEVIRKIAKAISIPIQTGGGIRTMEAIEKKLSLGVERVIIGTAAVKNPKFVEEAVKAFGDHVAVGIDAKNGMVAVEGWEQVSSRSAVDLCLEMKALGVKTIIYTDISKDGMLAGPNIESTQELIDKTGLDIIASGGVTTMADLENVERIRAEGAIIGKALYQGTLDLKEVIQRFEKR